MSTVKLNYSAMDNPNDQKSETPKESLKIIIRRVNQTPLGVRGRKKYHYFTTFVGQNPTNEVIDDPKENQGERIIDSKNLEAIVISDEDSPELDNLQNPDENNTEKDDLQYFEDDKKDTLYKPYSYKHKKINKIVKKKLPITLKNVPEPIVCPNSEIDDLQYAKRNSTEIDVFQFSEDDKKDTLYKPYSYKPKTINENDKENLPITLNISEQILCSSSDSDDMQNSEENSTKTSDLQYSEDNKKDTQFKPYLCKTKTINENIKKSLPISLKISEPIICPNSDSDDMQNSEENSTKTGDLQYSEDNKKDTLYKPYLYKPKKINENDKENLPIPLNISEPILCSSSDSDDMQNSEENSTKVDVFQHSKDDKKDTLYKSYSYKPKTINENDKENLPIPLNISEPILCSSSDSDDMQYSEKNNTEKDVFQYSKDDKKDTLYKPYLYKSKTINENDKENLPISLNISEPILCSSSDSDDLQYSEKNNAEKDVFQYSKDDKKDTLYKPYSYKSKTINENDKENLPISLNISEPIICSSSDSDDMQYSEKNSTEIVDLQYSEYEKKDISNELYLYKSKIINKYLKKNLSNPLNISEPITCSSSDSDDMQYSKKKNTEIVNLQYSEDNEKNTPYEPYLYKPKTINKSVKKNPPIYLNISEPITSSGSESDDMQYSKKKSTEIVDLQYSEDDKKDTPHEPYLYKPPIPLENVSEPIVCPSEDLEGVFDQNVLNILFGKSDELATEDELKTILETVQSWNCSGYDKGYRSEPRNSPFYPKKPRSDVDAHFTVDLEKLGAGGLVDVKRAVKLVSCEELAKDRFDDFDKMVDELKKTDTFDMNMDETLMLMMRITYADDEVFASLLEESTNALNLKMKALDYISEWCTKDDDKFWRGTKPSDFKKYKK